MDLLVDRASVSPRMCRRSLWPRITYLQPRSQSMAALSSPVNAPFGSWYMFWAPRATFEPAMARPTASR